MNRKKTKYNPDVLKEEVNKFKVLSEYSFYTGENDMNDKKGELLLGDIEEADEEPTPDDLEPADTDSAVDAVAGDLGVDNESGADDETTGDIEDVDIDVDADEAPAETPAPATPAGDEVEIDVTDLVQGSKEAKQSADNASQNTSQLLAKFSELEGKVAAMDNLTKKIDTLEKEIVKRNPTPVEKMEMRSLNSYPYSLKLTDYWSEKEGTHDVTSGPKKEYVLTKDDVNADYSDSKIKQSFNAPEEGNDFTEEDI